MLRVFLKSKLFSGKGDEKDKPNSRPLRPSKNRNRRLFERYNVSQQHLTVLNDQDIFIIRDLSTKGFSSDVSERAFLRFNIGDAYSGRIHYIGQLFDIKMKVSWKRNKAVGFEIIEQSKMAARFIKRLLKPMEIGQSLRKVESQPSEDSDMEKVWFNGIYDTNLFIWFNSSREIESWQLNSDKTFVEWTKGQGVTTGTHRVSPITKNTRSIAEPELLVIRDKKVNDNRLQFAIDLFATVPAELAERLLQTI